MNVMPSSAMRRTNSVSVSSIENFRDFGGYRAGRHRLRSGALFRSAALGRASDEDLAVLGRIGVQLVADLRRLDERELDVSRRWRGFSAEIICSDAANDRIESWLEFVSRANPDQIAMDKYMRGYYREAPFEPRHLDLFTRYFEALSRTDSPILVHCSAGKDRTGILVALTQALAGVADDDIVHEFLLTNAHARLDERSPAIAAHLGSLIGQRPNPCVVKAALTVEPHYLEAAFGAMRAQHGSKPTCRKRLRLATRGAPRLRRGCLSDGQIVSHREPHIPVRRRAGADIDAP